MLELVIFDMDGLMFATEQVNCRAFMEVVKEEGYHPTFEQFTSFLGMNVDFPFNTSTIGFYGVIIFSILVTVVITFILRKRDLL